MPCGHKWKNKTMRRIPAGRARGIGHLQGQWTGERTWDTDRYARYQPGCQPIVAPGVRYSFDAGSRGLFGPQNICGAVPVDCDECIEPPPCEPTAWRDNPADHHPEIPPPWWYKAGHCCEGAAYGHECGPGCPSHKAGGCSGDCGGACGGACGGDCKCGKGVGDAPKPRRSRKSKGVGALKRVLRPGRGKPRNGIGSGMSGCGGGCDPSMGGNPSATGCAAGTRPHGQYWGTQRHFRRWPPEHRSAPYPIPQRPYTIGMDISLINEPFSMCPTCGCCYYADPTCE